MQIWQNGDQLFSNRADWRHIMALTCFKGGTECAKKMKTRIYAAPAVKGFNIAILTINPVNSDYIENQIGKKNLFHQLIVWLPRIAYMHQEQLKK